MPVNRVTPEMIDDEIHSAHYFTAADGVTGHAFTRIYQGDEDIHDICENVSCVWEGSPEPLHLLTFCILVLKNGYTVTGQSSCVDPATFNPLTGREIALENAKEKVWPLLGFRLKDAAK